MYHTLEKLTDGDEEKTAKIIHRIKELIEKPNEALTGKHDKDSEKSKAKTEKEIEKMM